jgi:two-component system, LytTR family, response regulator
MSKARKKIRTLIVDDEPVARRNLRALLSVDPDVEIIGECSGGADAVEAVRAMQPDLVLLDVQMPEMNGFEVIEALGPRQMPAVIFVTAFDQFALRAFEVHALDYLLKPFDDSRFEMALSRAKSQIEQREASEIGRKLFTMLEDLGRPQPREQKRTVYVEKFMIKSSGRIFFLRADEIDWIEAADYYVRLHAGRHSHMLRETMADLEAKLDPEKFLRIHRSTIVNLSRVKQVQSRAGGEYAVVLEDGTQLKLSRSRREQLEMILERVS